VQISKAIKAKTTLSGRKKKGKEKERKNFKLNHDM